MFSLFRKKVTSTDISSAAPVEAAPQQEVVNRPAAFFDVEDEFWTLHDIIHPETMTSIERQYILWSAMKHITRCSIPGDFVECGVWRGGSSMLAALTLIKQGDTSRNLWLYDTFDGMPEPEVVDIEYATRRAASDIMAEQPREAGHGVWAIVARETVETNMARTSYPSQRIRYVEGLVEETLEHISGANSSAQAGYRFLQVNDDRT